MNHNDFHIRQANQNDCALILEFIKMLAKYENKEHHVKVTENSILSSIFEHKQAEVIIGEYQNVPVSYALYYYRYSSFVGCTNLYLEDLYVIDQYRGKGFGKLMFCYLAKTAVAKECGRMDWSCLNWNHNSISFYKSLGAVSMNDCTTYSLEGDVLNDLAK